MPIPLADLKLEVKKYLDQAANMSLGEVPDGTGGTALDNDSVLLTYLNEGQNEIARSCFPIFTQGTKANFPAGGRSIPLHQMTVPSGFGRLWAAVSVAFNTVPLQETLYSTMLNRRPDFAFKASSTPTIWFEYGTKATVGIDPAPSLGTQSLSVYGLCLPPALVDATTDLDFMPSDEAIRLVPLAAAILIAKKKYGVADLYGRLGHLIPDYEELRMRHWEMIEPGIRKKHYPVPPVLGAGDGKK